MSEYFPTPHGHSGGNINVKLHLTKSDLKNTTRVHTSTLATKSNLAKLKAEVDKIDLNKLKLFLLI